MSNEFRIDDGRAFHIDDGRASNLVHYWSRERALADLGLAE